MSLPILPLAVLCLWMLLAPLVGSAMVRDLGLKGQERAEFIKSAALVYCIGILIFLGASLLVVIA